MIRVGNTAREVRSFLTRDERTSLRDIRPPANLPLPGDMPVFSRIERQTFAYSCPRCGRRGNPRVSDPAGLCVAPTGLPASAPHTERIRRALP